MSKLLKQFKTDGYLILKEFNSPEECDELMRRAAELTANFDYTGHPAVFQTSEQDRERATNISSIPAAIFRSFSKKTRFDKKWRIEKTISCIRSIRSGTRCTILIRFSIAFRGLLR